VDVVCADDGNGVKVGLIWRRNEGEE
jgi:hypothetical protein